MPPITIIVAHGTVRVSNPVAQTDRDDPAVVWNVRSDHSVTLANPPIRFTWPLPTGTPPPTGCANWSEFTGEHGPGPGGTYVAVTPDLGEGQQQCYKYDVVWTTGSLDPEIENQGPPPMDGEEEEPPRGGGPKPK